MASNSEDHEPAPQLMVVDTSALVAVLRDEPERQAITEAIERTESCWLSAAGFVHAASLLDGEPDAEGADELDRFLATAGIDIVPVDVEQARVARQAFADYGGRHRAGLAFSDCFGYALAKVSGRPLLYKGAHLLLTDVVAMPYGGRPAANPFVGDLGQPRGARTSPPPAG